MVTTNMPRKKLSRQAKKSRTTLYKKSTGKREESPPPVDYLSSEPATSSPAPPPPATSVASSSPGLNAMATCSPGLNVTATCSPELNAMATCSPSLHDLTVTYDYSTDHAPLSSNPLSTDRFLALFPFTESPTTHRNNTGKGARLWTDLRPPVNVKHHKQQKDQSSEIHQLNVIARKLQETLTEHRSTAQESMTFNSVPTRLNFSEEESNGSDSSNHGDVGGAVSDPDEGGGSKESEEDWFWSQVALQVDATTSHTSLSHASAPHTSTSSTVSHTTQAITHTVTASIQSHFRQPITHTVTSSTQSHPISASSRWSGGAERSVRRQLNRPPTADPPVKHEDWGSSCDDEFVDQLLTQGVGFTPTTLQLGGSAKHANTAGSSAVTSGSKPHPKCSQKEIERKRELAKQKLLARLKRQQQF